MAAVYAGAAAIIAVVIRLAFADRMPIFFIDGQGGTLLRTLVVSAAVLFFLLTAGLLWRVNRRAPSPFLHWYSLGLALVAAGLAGSMVIVVRDSPLQWVTRFTQIMGLLYMCVAVLVSTRGRKTREIPLSAVEDARRQSDLIGALRQQTLLGWTLRYGLAVVAVAAALVRGWRWRRGSAPDSPPYITFYPAVMVVGAARPVSGRGCWLRHWRAWRWHTGFCRRSGRFTIASPVDRLALVLFLAAWACS